MQDVLEVIANSSALGVFHWYLGLCCKCYLLHFHVLFLRPFEQSPGGVYLEILVLVSKATEILEI